MGLNQLKKSQKNINILIKIQNITIIYKVRFCWIRDKVLICNSANKIRESSTATTLNLHWTMKEVLSHSGPSFQLLCLCITTLTVLVLVEFTKLKPWQLLLQWQANSSQASLGLLSHQRVSVALLHFISCLLENHWTSLLRPFNLKRYPTSSYTCLIVMCMNKIWTTLFFSVYFFINCWFNYKNIVNIKLDLQLQYVS